MAPQPGVCFSQEKEIHHCSEFLCFKQIQFAWNNPSHCIYRLKAKRNSHRWLFRSLALCVDWWIHDSTWNPKSKNVCQFLCLEKWKPQNKTADCSRTADSAQHGKHSADCSRLLCKLGCGWVFKLFVSGFLTPTITSSFPTHDFRSGSNRQIHSEKSRFGKDLESGINCLRTLFNCTQICSIHFEQTEKISEKTSRLLLYQGKFGCFGANFSSLLNRRSRNFGEEHCFPDPEIKSHPGPNSSFMHRGLFPKKPKGRVWNLDEDQCESTTSLLSFLFVSSDVLFTQSTRPICRFTHRCLRLLFLRQTQRQYSQITQYYRYDRSCTVFITQEI